MTARNFRGNRQAQTITAGSTVAALIQTHNGFKHPTALVFRNARPVIVHPKVQYGSVLRRTNFDVFRHVFNEQYAFFELRDINWRQQYDENLDVIESVTDEEVLFEVLTEMIDVLR